MKEGSNNDILIAVVVIGAILLSCTCCFVGPLFFGIGSFSLPFGTHTPPAVPAGPVAPALPPVAPAPPIMPTEQDPSVAMPNKKTPNENEQAEVDADEESKSGSPTKVSAGTPEVRGSLDKEVIRRVIRRRQSAVRRCYETQLRTKPDLAGKVTVRFIVSSTGSVQTATTSSSTLDDKTTERCLLSVVKRMRFPKPQGGGIVVVNYPFIFTASN